MTAVQDYRLAGDDRHLIEVGDTAAVLRDEMTPGRTRPRFLVWRGALLSEPIYEAFRDPRWPMRIFQAMSRKDGWDWRVRTMTDGQPVNDDRAAEMAIVRASGLKGPPAGNVLASVEIRDYQDHGSWHGGLEWWREKDFGSVEDSFVRELIARICDVLERAKQESINLYIEKLSIVLGKDAAAPLATHLPLLHSDMYYGVRETAICAITERGFNPHGAGIFLPTLNMETLSALGPLYIDDIYAILDGYPIVQTGSGDLIMYDGMIGQDGSVSEKNGVPHISPDVAGKSSRLTLLMRRVALGMSRQ